LEIEEEELSRQGSERDDRQSTPFILKRHGKEHKGGT